MENKLATTFKTVELPKRTFAYIRNVGPYMGDTKLFERLFNEVIGYLSPNQLLSPTSECISLYHDDPESVPVDQQRISVGFTVAKGTQGEGNIQIMELPASKFFVGEFEIFPNEYGQAWGEVVKQLKENNMTVAGMMYESYKNDPKQHPEGKHVVDICTAVI
jgi:AraC family transcriptional regulator